MTILPVTVTRWRNKILLDFSSDQILYFVQYMERKTRRMACVHRGMANK